MTNMFLHGCSDHQDQLFCLFELKKASLALRIESRFEKIFSMGISCKISSIETPWNSGFHRFPVSVTANPK